MGAIVIKTDSKSNRLLKALAEKLGGRAFTIDDEQYEDLALGALIDKEKTGELINRDEIFEKLNNQ
jgi:hypothetical protein